MPSRARDLVNNLINNLTQKSQKSRKVYLLREQHWRATVNGLDCV